MTDKTADSMEDDKEKTDEVQKAKLELEQAVELIARSIPKKIDPGLRSAIGEAATLIATKKPWAQGNFMIARMCLERIEEKRKSLSRRSDLAQALGVVYRALKEKEKKEERAVIERQTREKAEKAVE